MPAGREKARLPLWPHQLPERWIIAYWLKTHILPAVRDYAEFPPGFGIAQQCRDPFVIAKRPVNPHTPHGCIITDTALRLGVVFEPAYFGKRLCCIA